MKHIAMFYITFKNSVNTFFLWLYILHTLKVYPILTTSKLSVKYMCIYIKDSGSWIYKTYEKNYDDINVICIDNIARQVEKHIIPAVNIRMELLKMSSCLQTNHWVTDDTSKTSPTTQKKLDTMWMF